MIHIGTSGFSYEDWRGHFYPNGMNKKDFLGYYSKFFDTCEINSTYYSPPTRRMIEGLIRKSEGKVIFCIKASKKITHENSADDSFFDYFIEAIEPLISAEKLGAVLAQFPQSLKPDIKAKELLEKICEKFKGLPVVFEFRHRLWARESVFKWMSERDIGLCCVDEPAIGSLFPPIIRVTSKKLAYLRFHGRNAGKWYEHKKAFERYDYLYTEEEIRQWVPKIKQLDSDARDVFIFYNNHFQSKAVQNAIQLKEILNNL